MDWTVTWEDDLGTAEHAELATLLGRCFPHSRRIGGARSWSSARPEVRLVGRVEGRAVAHLGVLRRHLRFPDLDRDLLVGDVGLVGIDPARHGQGIGARLLAEATAALDRWALPFGFLTTAEQLTGFYAGGGWARVRAATRMLEPDGRVSVWGGPSMVLPVRSALTDWPDADAVDRNGYEV